MNARQDHTEKPSTFFEICESDKSKLRFHKNKFFDMVPKCKATYQKIYSSEMPGTK